MKENNLASISEITAPQMGANTPNPTKREDNLINFPDIFPANFPQNFPDLYPNTLEISGTEKFATQYFPKLSLRFYLHNAKSNTPTPILIYLRVNGITFRYNSNLKVLPQNWDKSTQTAIISETQNALTQHNNLMLNYVINSFQNWRVKILRCIYDHALEIDADEINLSLTKHINNMNYSNKKSNAPKEKVKEYFNVIRALRNQADKKNDSTAKEYYSRINNLEVYIKDNNLSDNLYDFDYTFAFNYKEYLNTSENSYTRCKAMLSTIQTLIKEIGNDPNFSYEYDPKIDMLEIDPNKEKRSLQDKQENQFVLSTEEIEALENIELTNTKYRQVRDIFLLQCYTACRYSDIPQLLDKSNYIVLEDGRGYVRYMDEKEGKRKSKLNYVNAPLWLEPKAKELWLKLTSEKIIAPIGKTQGSSFNDILKRIAKKTNAFNSLSTFINPRGKEVTEPHYKRIKSHSGRHTFITKWCETFSPDELINFTGHADTKCINNNYLHRSEKMINNQLARIGKKFSKAENNKQNADITPNSINSNEEVIKAIKSLKEELTTPIQTLREELTSPKLKELEEWKELFSDNDKYDRIDELALLNDIENVRRDLEEEGIKSL